LYIFKGDYRISYRKRFGEKRVSRRKCKAGLPKWEGRHTG